METAPAARVYNRHCMKIDFLELLTEHSNFG